MRHSLSVIDATGRVKGLSDLRSSRKSTGGGDSRGFRSGAGANRESVYSSAGSGGEEYGRVGEFDPSGANGRGCESDHEDEGGDEEDGGSYDSWNGGGVVRGGDKGGGVSGAGVSRGASNEGQGAGLGADTASGEDGFLVSQFVEPGVSLAAAIRTHDLRQGAEVVNHDDGGDSGGDGDDDEMDTLLNVIVVSAYRCRSLLH